MTAATDAVCHILDQDETKPNLVARDNYEQDIRRSKGDIVEFLYEGGYIAQLEVFIEECPMYVEGFDFSIAPYR